MRSQKKVWLNNATRNEEELVDPHPWWKGDCSFLRLRMTRADTLTTTPHTDSVMMRAPNSRSCSAIPALLTPGNYQKSSEVITAFRKLERSMSAVLPDRSMKKHFNRLTVLRQRIRFPPLLESLPLGRTCPLLFR